MGFKLMLQQHNI